MRPLYYSKAKCEYRGRISIYSFHNIFFLFNFVFNMLFVQFRYSSPSFFYLCVLHFFSLHVAQVFLYVILVHGFHGVIFLGCETSHF